MGNGLWQYIVYPFLVGGQVSSILCDDSGSARGDVIVGYMPEGGKDKESCVSGPCPGVIS